MAIITKPAGGILKGVPASISLSKSELSALSIIVADSYFSNTSNWNKVILKYRSSTGKQYEAVQFDATLSSPTGNFLVSIKARDAFEIQTIEIHDFDNDIFIVPRSALNVADFDVVLLSAPSSLSYSTPVTYTQNTAITNNVPTVTGTVTSYSILPALPAGLNFNTTTGVISGTPTEVSAAANYVVTASNEAGSTTATINITVESAEVPEYSFDGRTDPNYITFPTPTSVTRLQPSINVDGSGLSNFWMSTPITGDFTYTATVKTGASSDPIIQALFGITDTIPATTSYGVKHPGWGIVFSHAYRTAYMWEISQDNQVAWTAGSTHTIEIKRTSGVVSYKVDNSAFPYTLTTSATLYIAGSMQVGAWELTNAQLVVPEVPVGDPIMWDLFLNGATTEADGGLIGASTAAYSFTKSNASKIANGADFTITYKFTFPVGTDIVTAPERNWCHGISNDLTEEGSQFDFTGLTYQSSSLISYYRGVQQSNQSLSAVIIPGENTLVIEKTGTNLTFTLNNTVVLSKTDYTEQLTVPAVRPWNVRALDSAYVEIISATNYINWDLLTGYQAGSLTITPTSGVSGGISLAGDDVAVKSDADKATGDFDYTFKFDWSSASSVNNMFAGVTGNNVTSGTSPLFYDRLTCIYGNGDNPDTANLWHNGLPVGGTTQTLLSGVNTYRLKRVDTTITHYLNDVQIYSAISNSFTAYPSVRTMGNSVVTESYITELIPITSEYFTYTHNPDSLIISNTGGVSGGPQSSFGAVSIEDSFVGDFSIQFKFNWDSFTHSQGYGSMDDAIFLGVRTELNSIYNQTGIAISEFDPGNSNKNIRFFNGGSSNTLYNVTPGDHVFVLVKIGNDWKYYIDGVLRYQAQYSFSQPLYPAVKTRGFVACTESREIEFVTWNVAGKTGVGTVTTGDNGLITKATGGAGYNVNVLSNETITGDGYVEFIYSSIFLNVVFGVAEVNSSSGSYDQIIYGTYVAIGAYEKVLAGQAIGGAMGTSVNGDVIRIQRTGTTFSILKNGSVIDTVTINNTNPLKVSISIYPSENYGVNNVTISE